MHARYVKHILQFKRPGGTSRGILHTKETWFLIREDQGKQGVGECALFRGLSADDRPDYEAKLQWVCKNIALGSEKLLEQLCDWPSIRFGLEQAFLMLENDGRFQLFPSDFTAGKADIPINGLIWMGSEAFMKEQIEAKLQEGFTTLKLKIGAIDFEAELGLLRFIRNNFKAGDIEIRVDANGAFSRDDALVKLKRLSDFDLHSIEQPIQAGQWQEMAALCEQTPLPIALDEELIGIYGDADKEKMLSTIQPQFIILKPALAGGFESSLKWIQAAEKYKAGWWITSALESNIGLNAIAQFTYHLGVNMPQGLGTGGLFTNNFESPLEVDQGFLHFNPAKQWDFNL
ncbi:MAG: o-succinylbenzoate synthase [Flavobacteriaceae bacterium]|nr:o-succinylbenzoate synthase [Flavobacteriaceae bacterium]